jgi:hypothetical protein
LQRWVVGACSVLPPASRTQAAHPLLSWLTPPPAQVAYDLLSPLHCARAADPVLARFMPPCLLVHGTNDKSVPHAGSVMMDQALRALRVASSCQLHKGKTHTDFLLEDAMAGEFFWGGAQHLVMVFVSCSCIRCFAFHPPVACLFWGGGGACDGVCLLSPSAASPSTLLTPPPVACRRARRAVRLHPGGDSRPGGGQPPPAHVPLCAGAHSRLGLPFLRAGPALHAGAHSRLGLPCLRAGCGWWGCCPLCLLFAAGGSNPFPPLFAAPPPT